MEQIECKILRNLKETNLLNLEEANNLANLFKTLANDTRLRIIHAILKYDDICLTDLAKIIDLRPQAVSNQIQRLVDKGIIKASRDKNNVKYKIIDPCVQRLLESGLCILKENLK